MFELGAGTPDVYLTFDDGPDPVNTPRVLDVLARFGARATFFVIGRNASAYPALVQRMSAEGHTVGNHTFTHGEPSEVSARTLGDEVRRTRDLLSTLTGKVPRLVRPPKGKVTVSKLLTLWRDGQTVVLWSRDPKDYECETASVLADRLAASRPAPGDIVLLHDRVAHTADVLDRLLTDCTARGLTCSGLPHAYRERAG